ncbi:hypothetical protein KUTeg_021885 [Tegillarca granosa]|uniref:Regulator of G-protein signaling 3 n=1 Tax=Tegillarca granosa TaxID=220873 RepID=A0ABQ9E4M2_TEGGR|nr:hypothetical protein KUTeg_021885 [Tegillarca granosa]
MTGQLKLSAYMNFGLLTVHVVQARHLCSKWKPLCDSFVKMSLIPDDSKKSRCRTEPVMDSNNPLYDEKFSFELLEEDCNKRLLISVWHRDQTNSGSEFLGCMSFGIRHLLNPKKEVSGWYYLLTEDIGRKKHLQVSAKQKPLLKVKVQRGKHGFGFSVIESCPVKVGRVDGASPAENAGLRPGDCIIRVNNQNVSRSQAASVAKLVKNCGGVITLELQRQHLIPMETGQSCTGAVGADLELMEPQGMRYGQEQPMSSEHDTSEEYKENEISVDEGFFSLPSNLVTSTPLPLLCNGHRTVVNTVTSERRKQEATHRLLSVELDFIDSMHAGMQRYSRPLRHCILSQQQHSALFQNIEKLVTISEYHVKQMNDNVPSMMSSDTDISTSSESSQNFLQSIGMIYNSKVHMLCQAYDLYAKGLSETNHILSQLMRNSDFSKFIKHINDLYLVLKDIFTSTQEGSQDYKGLKQVVEGLQECITNINNYSCTSQAKSWSSSSSSHKHQRSSASSNSSSSGESHDSMSRKSKVPKSCSLQTVRSIDSEVLKIQDRLVFTSNVPVFQLCEEERHLIYAGDLFKWEGKQWCKLYVMLFSDILLETESDRDGHLQVVREPVFLKDVNATEFVMHCFKSGILTSGPPEMEKILYRAPSTELKYTWKSLLEQKVYSVRGALGHYSTSDCSGAAVIV